LHTMGLTNRKWLLAKRPQGMVRVDDFEMKEETVPELKEGEYLIKTQFLSNDPAQRGWMNGRDTYVKGIPLGGLVRAGGIGIILDSKDEQFKNGDWVYGVTGWQEYCIGKGKEFSLVASQTEPRLSLHICGIVGFTAYFGLLKVGEMKESDVVVVSGAAGATGSIAGQIAKLKGAKTVIGIAGGASKCEYITKELGFDHAIDYKSENVAQRLAELAPNGINVYFDNVGGEILDAALLNLASHARIVICGAISGYNSSPKEIKNHPQLILKRSRMEGFLAFDYANEYPVALKEMLQWYKEGKMKCREDIQEGFENIPKTFLRLFTGDNVGKQLTKL